MAASEKLQGSEGSLSSDQQRVSYRDFSPRAGSRVVRIDLLCFVARSRKRRLNKALSVLFLSLGFF